MCLDITLIMDKKQRFNLQSSKDSSVIFKRIKRSKYRHDDTVRILQELFEPMVSRRIRKMGEEINPDEARNIVYGMPYQEWKEKHQKPATQEQLDQMNARKNK